MAPVTARVALWRNVRFLRVLGQAVFVVLLVFVGREIFLNLEFGVREQNLDLSFDFLQQRAGFDIKEGIEYSTSESYLKAFLVGVVNTMRVAVVGIVLATLLGLVMGSSPEHRSPPWSGHHPGSRPERAASPAWGELPGRLA